MSLSVTWFAVQGIPKDEFLERAGFEDTGEPDEYFDEPYSGGSLPDGWYVIMTDDLELFDPAKMAACSLGGRLVAVLVHEETMHSLAAEWSNGRQVWSLSHDGGEGRDVLEAEGRLPDAFEALRQEAVTLQSEAADTGVSFVFDLPLDLAAEITGFRHDELGFDDELGPFNALERVHIA